MKRVKQCVKCGAKYSLSFFNYKNKGKNKRNVRCKYCTRQQVMASYYKNHQHYLRCVLQFDHVRGEKRMEVSAMPHNYLTIKQVEAEIRKCEVRCANCHSIKTAIERNYYSFVK